MTGHLSPRNLPIYGSHCSITSQSSKFLNISHTGLFRIYFICVLALELNLLTGSRKVASSLVMVAVYCIALIMLFVLRKPRNEPYHFDSIFVSSLTLLIFYSSSFFWSIDRIDTAIQILLYCAIFVASFLFSKMPSDFLIRVVLKSAIWVCLISLILIPLAPDVAFQPHWSTTFPEVRGIFSHQQRFGLFLCIALGVGIIARKNKWNGIFGNGVLRHYWVFVIIMIIGIIFAFARLNTIYALIALMLTLFFSRGALFQFSTLCIVVPSFIIVGISQGFLSGSYGLDDIVGDVSISGRTVIWEKTISIAREQNILGYGFGTFSSHYFDSVWGVYRPPHAHNSFVNAYFESGIVGLVLLMFTLATHIWRTMRSNRHPNMYSITMFLFLLTLFSSLTGVTYGGKQSVLYACLLLFLFNRPEEYFHSKQIEDKQKVTSSIDRKEQS